MPEMPPPLDPPMIGIFFEHEIMLGHLLWLRILMYQTNGLLFMHALSGCDTVSFF